MRHIKWKRIARVFAWPAVLIVAGLILNLVVKHLNGGMPVRDVVLATKGWRRWMPVLPSTRLGLLGDTIRSPLGYHSIGDVLMIGGLVFAIVNAMRSFRLKEIRKWTQ
jgi:hypothetical protein